MCVLSKRVRIPWESTLRRGGGPPGWRWWRDHENGSRDSRRSVYNYCGRSQLSEPGLVAMALPRRQPLQFRQPLLPKVVPQVVAQRHVLRLRRGEAGATAGAGAQHLAPDRAACAAEPPKGRHFIAGAEPAVGVAKKHHPPRPRPLQRVQRF